MIQVDSLEARLSKLSEWAKEEKLKTKLAEKQRLKLELTRTEQESLSKVLVQVGELFKSLGGGTQEELLSKLSQFVTYGLVAVFGEGYRFEPELNVEGKEYRITFYIETDEVRGQVDKAKGGGVAEVVSILLQVFFLVALRDRYAPFLFLDTAMVHISEQYHGNVSALLKELSDKLGIQVVLIVNTNSYGEYADRVYHFTQEGGKTIAEKEK